jgi:hypothetical protein
MERGREGGKAEGVEKGNVGAFCGGQGSSIMR